MLIRATLEDVEKYGDFIYEIALDRTKCAYPVYGDGIKTKTDFLADAGRAAAQENEELLLFVSDEKVMGWLSFFWIPKEHYLQLTACNVDGDVQQALGELLALLESRFRGYQLYFGFPGDNEDAIQFLKKNGFFCIEDAWNHSFFFENAKIGPEDGSTARIERENYSDFRAVYRPDESTYWNCDRILESLDEWIIYVAYRNGVAAGGIFLRGEEGSYEIFGTGFLNDTYEETVHRTLLGAAPNACSRRSAKYLTYFCGEQERMVAAEVGFVCVGRYVCYMKGI